MKWDKQTQKFLDQLALKRLDEANHLRSLFELPPRKVDHFSLEEMYAATNFSQKRMDRIVRPLKDWEREALTNALKQADGNRAVAAKMLGVARSTVFQMLKRHKTQD